MILRGLYDPFRPRWVFFLCLLVITVSAVAQKKPVSATNAKSNKTDTTFSFKVFSAGESSFGYDVYKGGKLMIHQPSIPGMPGNKGFKDKATAAKAAKLVMKKIRQGQMPPTLTIEELRKGKAID